MDDGELQFALRSYKSTRLLEVSKADAAFCGWDVRMPGNAKSLADFEEFADSLLASSDPAQPAKVSTSHQAVLRAMRVKREDGRRGAREWGGTEHGRVRNGSVGEKEREEERAEEAGSAREEARLQ